jgi:hypothetical protein
MGVYNITLKSADVLDDKSSETITKTETTEANVVPHDQASEKKEEKTIVLDGPLSHIYTQALNAVYATEAINMLTEMSINEDDTYGKKETNEKGKDLYVYCCDGDRLDSGELANVANKLRLALDTKHYKNVVVAVECTAVNNKIALLDNFTTDLGVKIMFNRNTAISKIKSVIGT